MVSLSHDPSILAGFDPDSGSEVHSKMLKATMVKMKMMTRRRRACLNMQQKEQQTD